MNCIVFAPVALIMPYETIEEAIEIANGTSYALGASVFGTNSLSLEWRSLATAVTDGVVDAHVLVVVVTSACQGLIWQ